MKNIIIIGSGGFSLEIVEYIHNNQGSQTYFPYEIKGFLDINSKSYNQYQHEYPLLGDEYSYQIDCDDVFVLAISEHGLMETRKRIVKNLIAKKAKFINLIHHTCNIPNSLDIGQGNIIAPYTIVGPKTKIGNFNTLNYHSSLAHESSVGNFNVLSPNTVITGCVQISDSNFIGASTTILPGFCIGSNNKIQSGLVLDKNIENNLFVFSNTKNRELNLGNID